MHTGRHPSRTPSHASNSPPTSDDAEPEHACGHRTWESLGAALWSSDAFTHPRARWRRLPDGRPRPPGRRICPRRPDHRPRPAAAAAHRLHLRPGDQRRGSAGDGGGVPGPAGGRDGAPRPRHRAPHDTLRPALSRPPHPAASFARR
ncbi:hypothetical protein [Ornithinimicrobium kibberense]|uniref:hypothetical protein n=1 Tax=Ornithinimicrobium kibberense TaxID=282060 RepID=UPI00360CD51A